MVGIKKTRAQIQAEVSEIGRMLGMGMLDMEIMKQLNLKRAMYYIYKQKLFRQYADLFEKERVEDLGYHKELLHDRLTKLYRQTEVKLSLKKPNSEEPFIDSKDYAATVAVAQNLAINIFKLESEGLRILNEFGSRNQSGNGYLRSINQPELRLFSSDSIEGPTDGEATQGGGEKRITSFITDEKPESDESEIY